MWIVLANDQRPPTVLRRGHKSGVEKVPPSPDSGPSPAWKIAPLRACRRQTRDRHSGPGLRLAKNNGRKTPRGIAVRRGRREQGAYPAIQRREPAAGSPGASRGPRGRTGDLPSPAESVPAAFSEPRPRGAERIGVWTTAKTKKAAPKAFCGITDGAKTNGGAARFGGRCSPWGRLGARRNVYFDRGSPDLAKAPVRAGAPAPPKPFVPRPGLRPRNSEYSFA